MKESINNDYIYIDFSTSKNMMVDDGINSDYRLTLTNSLYDFFKYCYYKESHKDIRYICFITDKQLIIGLGDNNYYYGHLDISKNIQKIIFPNRHYLDNNYNEYNQALRIYGYGYDSAFGDFPTKVSINQYNYLLMLIDECIKFENDFNIYGIKEYYESIKRFAKTMIKKDTNIELDEIIIGITKEDKNKVKIKKLK